MNIYKVLSKLGRIPGIRKLYTDKFYLKVFYKHRMNEKLDLNHPRTFNQKLQWLKLNDRNDLYTQLADKFLVREIVADKIGEEHLIPLLGSWDRVEDIDVNELPNQFVLKCNHNSGLGMLICKDKSKVDWTKSKSELKKGLQEKYYWSSREWQYKNIPPKIICEKFMVDDSPGGIVDYKFMCFNGKVKALFVCTGREIDDLKITYYDEEWNRLPLLKEVGNYEGVQNKPENLGKMIEMAEKLAGDLKFVRIDFYDIKGKIYFGEYTFHPDTGIAKFEPREWDITFGNWLQL